MSQVSCDDSFLRLPRLIFFRQGKARREIRSQMRWHLLPKKCAFHHWQLMLNVQSMVPIRLLKLLLFILVDLCLLRSPYTNCILSLFVWQPVPRLPKLKGQDLRIVFKCRCFLRLAEFLHNDHLAQPWGAAAWDNNCRATAGVSVRAWARSSRWGGFIVSYSYIKK